MTSGMLIVFHFSESEYAELTEIGNIGGVALPPATKTVDEENRPMMTLLLDEATIKALMRSAQQRGMNRDPGPPRAIDRRLFARLVATELALRLGGRAHA